MGERRFPTEAEMERLSDMYDATLEAGLDDWARMAADAAYRAEVDRVNLACDAGGPCVVTGSEPAEPWVAPFPPGYTRHGRWIWLPIAALAMLIGLMVLS